MSERAAGGPSSASLAAAFSAPSPRFAGRRKGYLIACGLSGEPVPPVMTSGGPQKKNS